MQNMIHNLKAMKHASKALRLLIRLKVTVLHGTILTFGCCTFLWEYIFIWMAVSWVYILCLRDNFKIPFKEFGRIVPCLHELKLHEK